MDSALPVPVRRAPQPPARFQSMLAAWGAQMLPVVPLLAQRPVSPPSPRLVKHVPIAQPPARARPVPPALAAISPRLAEPVRAAPAPRLAGMAAPLRVPAL